MTFEEKLRAILAEDVLDADEPVPAPPPPPPPRRTLTISALGGRPSVDVDEDQFRHLLDRAADATGPDLQQADLGRLIWLARDVGPPELLAALLRVRAPSAVFRVRDEAGRPWRLSHHTTNTD